MEVEINVPNPKLLKSQLHVMIDFKSIHSIILHIMLLMIYTRNYIKPLAKSIMLYRAY